MDFVLELRRQLVGIEIKSSGHPSLADVPGLRTFLTEHPKSARGGVVLHGGNDSYWLDGKILAVPWWRVM